jgi:NYN domain/OST-HTH/LOTUS domain
MTDATRVAVLIDCDNISHQWARAILGEIAKHGTLGIKRGYGDWTSDHLKNWRPELATYAIQPVQQFAYTVGKNSTDFALVIDAMDLLYSGRMDGFCLVSSDSDFTRLASRIREQGIDIYGFGEQKTPESFRQACHRFIYTENLLPDAPAAGRDAAPGAKASKQSPSAAVPLLRKALDQMEDDDGWVHLGGVGQQLNKLFPDFDPRTYGVAKLADLVKKSGAFEIDRSSGRAVHIRLKPAAGKEAAGKAGSRA